MYGPTVSCRLTREPGRGPPAYIGSGSCFLHSDFHSASHHSSSMHYLHIRNIPPHEITCLANSSKGLLLTCDILARTDTESSEVLVIIMSTINNVLLYYLIVIQTYTEDHLTVNSIVQ